MDARLPCMGCGSTTVVVRVQTHLSDTALLGNEVMASIQHKRCKDDETSDIGF